MNKIKIYELLVNRHPGIRERYQEKRGTAKGKAGHIRVWLYLLWLNISYYVLRDKSLDAPLKYPYYERKRLYSSGSESSLSKKKDPKEAAAELSSFDVISFDVFDTLIFRPFSKPSDLFYILGERLSYPDLKNIREKAESRARDIRYKKDGHREITIDEIWKLLKDETGLKESEEELCALEVAVEEEFAFANPYMSEVVSELKKAGKRLIITSDMYLRKENIEGILRKAGYPPFDEYYISCEYSCSKSDGNLYELVRQRETGRIGRGALSFAHVGDNEISDIKRAKEHGFYTFYIDNVNSAGRRYRPEDMSCITGSMYSGIVNSHIHCGLREYSREYEYGYIYGGLFVAGYCGFIHDCAEKEGAQKLLFLSRDGDVLKRAYGVLYPEEKNTEYVYWSRLAAAKLTAADFKYDYFRRFIYHKVNQGISLDKIFSSMEISFLLEDESFEMSALRADMILTDKNADDVRDHINKNFGRVLDSYKEQNEAAKMYYGNVLSGATKALAVDIGWAGSGAISLDHMVNKVWGLGCEIKGVVAGTNTCHNSEPDFSETYLQSGKLMSYLYSQRHNRDLWKKHDPGRLHNLYLETLLDAPGGSLKGFYPDKEKGYELRFKNDSNDEAKVLEIRRGILDFVSEWKTVSEKAAPLGEISGRDAYAPFIIMEDEKNRTFMKAIAVLADEAGI